MKEQKKETHLNKYGILYILIPILIAMYLGYYYLITSNYSIDSSVSGSAGLYGDMFGGLNAFISGLAFIGLIWALRLQKNEIELQKEELFETRKEISNQTREFKEQKEIMNSQLDIMKDQNKEDFFFNLLNTFSSRIDNLKTKETHGREIFDKLTDNFDRIIKIYNNILSKNPRKKVEEINSLEFRELKLEIKNSAVILSTISFYFETAIFLFKYIEQNFFSKKQYLNILLATISWEEMYLIQTYFTITNPSEIQLLKENDMYNHNEVEERAHLLKKIFDLNQPI